MCIVLRSASKFRLWILRYTTIFASPSMWYAAIYNIQCVSTKKNPCLNCAGFYLSSYGQLIKIYWHRWFKFASAGWTLLRLMRQLRWCVILWEIWRPTKLRPELNSPQDLHAILAIHHYTFFIGALSNSCLLWTQPWTTRALKDEIRLVHMNSSRDVSASVCQSCDHNLNLL